MTTASSAPALDTEDGCPASWSEPLSLRQRLAGFAWRVCLGLGISGWLASVQLANNVSGPEWFWTLGIFVLAVVMAVRSFRRREVRRYASTVVRYTVAQRLKRAAKWFLAGVAMLAFIWGVQVSDDRLSDYWWYAWPALLPLVVGTGLFLLRSERVLSGPGQHAKAQHEAANVEQKELQRRAIGSRFEGLLQARLVRYPLAGVVFWIAYLFGQSDDRRAWMGVLAAVICGIWLAREVFKWGVGLIIICAIAWAVIAGVSALPVSVAVIVGALIIASAVGKK